MYHFVPGTQCRLAVILYNIVYNIVYFTSFFFHCLSLSELYNDKMNTKEFFYL